MIDVKQEHYDWFKNKREAILKMREDAELTDEQYKKRLAELKAELKKKMSIKPKPKPTTPPVAGTPAKPVTVGTPGGSKPGSVLEPGKRIKIKPEEREKLNRRVKTASETAGGGKAQLIRKLREMEVPEKEISIMSSWDEEKIKKYIADNEKK